MYRRSSASISYIVRMMHPGERADGLVSFLLCCTLEDVSKALGKVTQNAPTARKLGADLIFGGEVDPDDDRWDWLWKQASVNDLAKLAAIRGGEEGVPEKHRHAILDLAVEAKCLSLLLEIGFFKGLSANTKAVAKHIKLFIDADNMAQLMEADKCGLIHPRRIDEYITRATEVQRPAILAYLLEWKNQNVDVAAESKKAEARDRRLLNANPNSVTELSKLWRYEKLVNDNVTTLCILKYKGKETVVRIPDAIGKAMVTTLGRAESKRWDDGVFGDNRDLEQVTLPQGLKFIYTNAFLRCRKLKAVVFPEGLEIIGERAFGDCESLEEITFPASLKSIGPRAFDYCDLLKRAVFTSGDVLIENQTYWDNPFRGCSNLTIHAPRGSAVHDFAKKLAITFAPLEEAQ